jgi:lipoprotein-anchoring transpeptidase ErfK/SrfK
VTVRVPHRVPYRAPLAALLALATLLAACDRDRRGRRDDGAEPLGDAREPSASELERQRLDTVWREVVQLDTTIHGDAAVSPERWESITAAAADSVPMFLPLFGDVAGPSVLRLQVLLDRALFSPGVIDGRWGQNTEKALFWLQRREGLPATARLDSATFERLVRVAGSPREIVVARALTADDVAGPFVKTPEDIYERAALDCLCYESLGEKLAERFHATQELLRKLNPGVELDALRAGDTLQLPNVRPDDAEAAARAARLVVSDRGRYVHALDAQGRVLFHFPSTLGSAYDPSPRGRLTVTRIAQDPWWHYQPSILANQDPDDEEAMIPPGPNSAVGVVWMALSEPHYGIHGTSAPETIGYTTSSGCVRLTNWDARFLSHRIASGVPVEFRDPRPRADE